MKKLIRLYIALAGLFLFAYGCEPKEEAKQPVANFEFFPASGIAPGDSVKFTNLTTDGKTYEWDFGDGLKSAEQHPIHKFNEAKEYTVTLVAKNNDLTSTISKKITVDIQLTACFTFSPSPAVVGQNINFTNCSEGADSYEWYKVGYSNVVSTQRDLILNFNVAGNFEVKLITKSGSSTAEVVHSITITENAIVIDPTDYLDTGIKWITEYYDDFSQSGTWYEDAGVDFQFIIANGFYTCINTNNAADHYGYTVTSNILESVSDNYDFEAIIRNRVDNENYGSGLIFGGVDGGGSNYFSYTIGYYTIGNFDNVWQPWTATADGYSEDWNKLTVRKYYNKYYFFINEIFLYSHDYSVYGDLMGFGFDKNTTVDIDEVAIYIMDFSTNKLGTKKQQVNTAQSKISSKIQKAKRRNSPLK